MPVAESCSDWRLNGDCAADECFPFRAIFDVFAGDLVELAAPVFGDRVRLGVGAWPLAAERVLREETGSPLAGPIPAMGMPARNVLIGDVVHELRDCTHDERVVLPVEMQAVMGRR